MVQYRSVGNSLPCPLHYPLLSTATSETQMIADGGPLKWARVVRMNEWMDGWDDVGASSLFKEKNKPSRSTGT